MMAEEKEETVQENLRNRHVKNVFTSLLQFSAPIQIHVHG